MFTVTGVLRRTGCSASISWDDGHLGGDPEAIVDVEMLVRSQDLVHATVTGPSHRATVNSEDGWWVQRTIIEVFEPRGLVVKGERPGPPPDTSVPPGAVS